MLCEHADALPLSAISRITDTHDLLVLFIPLIENPPWTRRMPDTGKWQKLVEQKWTDVAPIDLLKVTKLEGQPWIALYQLLAKEVFRERYHLNSFRKGQVLRARKFINDVLLDQLPFLADVQRYMDELTIMEVPESSGAAGGGSVFMLQQVAVAREGVIKKRDWKSAADKAMADIFTMTDKDDKVMLPLPTAECALIAPYAYASANANHYPRHSSNPTTAHRSPLPTDHRPSPRLTRTCDAWQTCTRTTAWGRYLNPWTRVQLTLRKS
jgi:hypothetical protein